MDHDPHCTGFTIGCAACIAAAHPRTPTPDGYADGLSYGARLTIRNNALLARGIHPATRHPIRHDVTCGGCSHCVVRRPGRKRFYKCELSTRGVTHGAASDIRVGWDGCACFEPRETAA